MTRQQKRDARNLRILQKMWMDDKARTIDSKTGQADLAVKARLECPDYKTSAYETLHEFLSFRIGNRHGAEEHFQNYVCCARCGQEYPKFKLREEQGCLVCHRC